MQQYHTKTRLVGEYFSVMLAQRIAGGENRSIEPRMNNREAILSSECIMPAFAYLVKDV